MGTALSTYFTVEGCVHVICSHVQSTELGRRLGFRIEQRMAIYKLYSAKLIELKLTELDRQERYE